MSPQIAPGRSITMLREILPPCKRLYFEEI
jgi:hypothetical protein